MKDASELMHLVPTAAAGDEDAVAPSPFAARAPTLHEVTTDDGWRLLLRRFPPRAEVPSGSAGATASRAPALPPVLMVHGHANSGWIWYGPRHGGLAGALADAGRDVWVAELRGNPGTEPTGGSARRADVRFSAKLRHDLPALTAAILEATAARQLDAVGHSLGGVLLMLRALGADTDGGAIRRLVVLSSPLHLEGGVPRWLSSAPFRALSRRLGRVPLGALGAKGGAALSMRAMGAHVDPRLLDHETFRAFLRHGLADTFGPELEEVLAWVRTGDPRVFSDPSLVGRPFRRLPVPTRFLVGAGDTLTTPAAARDAYEHLAGAEADFRIIGGATGARGDYRHADLLIAPSARLDVAPHVNEWLARTDEAQRAGHLHRKGVQRPARRGSEARAAGA